MVHPTLQSADLLEKQLEAAMSADLDASESPGRLSVACTVWTSRLCVPVGLCALLPHKGRKYEHALTRDLCRLFEADVVHIPFCPCQWLRCKSFDRSTCRHSMFKRPSTHTNCVRVHQYTEFDENDLLGDDGDSTKDAEETF